MTTILVAADVHGSKINLEFVFPVLPSVPQFKSQVESAFAVEVEDRRPPQAPPGFQVTRFQLYDETLQRWVDLTASSQLFDFCQLYTFQPPSQWHREIQAPIPAPVRARFPPTAGGGRPYGSPARTALDGVSPVPSHRAHSVMQRGPSQYTSGAPAMSEHATHDEKVRSTFDELDTNGNRVVELDELRKGFQVVANLNFTQQTVDDMFGKADANRDGLIQFAEWQRFCELYPTLLDALYFRFRAHWEDKKAQAELADLQEQAQRLKDALGQANEHCQDMEAESKAQEHQLKKQEAALNDAIESQRTSESELRQAAREWDSANKNKQSAESALQLQREHERQQGANLAEAQRDCMQAERRVAAAEAEWRRANDAFEVARQLDAEADGEVQRQRQLTDAAREDIAYATQAIDSANAERLAAQAAIQRSQAELEQQDRHVGDMQKNVRAAEIEHAEKVQLTQRALQKRLDDERLLGEQRDKEQEANMDCLAVKRSHQEQRDKEQEANMDCLAVKRSHQEQ
eukprot:Hpha_TRINITY_DN14068_c0_g1::TRINITY_DN14068_c0_g1_i5::g.43979::m.43979